MRQWRVAQYLLPRYRPQLRLAGDGLLLKRVDEASLKAGTAFVPHRDLWLEPVNLGALPWVWGRSARGAPPDPSTTLYKTSERIAAAKLLSIDLPSTATLRAADEMQVSFEPPFDGRCRVDWSARGSLNDRREVSFGVNETFAGPYRIRLASLPAWVWSSEPTRLTIRLTTRQATQINLEWKSEGN